MIFIFALVDLFTSEWVVETSKEYHFSKSVPHFIVKILMVVLSQVCILNDKIGVHENAVMFLYLCLMVIPVMMYLIKVSKIVLFL